MSLAESAANLAVGFAVSIALTSYLTGAALIQSAHWSAWFTVASLVRSYGLRRAFSRWWQ